tara:strand:+ start:2998 stop:3435 length:438 start_codon:yes stop_codon:yes gene_type:complete
MKITKSGLKKLIKEELEKTLNEKQARHMGQMRAEMVRALSEAIDLGGLENRPSQSTKLNRFMDPIVELFERVEELESDEPEYLRGPLPIKERSLGPALPPERPGDDRRPPQRTMPTLPHELEKRVTALENLVDYIVDTLRIVPRP